jgi:type IV pilus assembly protein PilE
VSRHPERLPACMSSGARSGGITLVELLVVLVAVGILASVAVPGFHSHLLRANRSEARAALLALATAQEKYYLQCHRYASELDPAQDTDCEAQRLRFPVATERGYYRLAVASADETGWVATVTPAGPPQDTDTRCRVLRLDAAGRRSALDAAGADSSMECWSR